MDDNERALSGLSGLIHFYSSGSERSASLRLAQAVTFPVSILGTIHSIKPVILMPVFRC